MSKPFHYWLRLALVSSLSVLLSFNPAFAGRLLNRAVCGWQAQQACDSPCVSPCVTPSGCCGESVVITSDCGCETPAASCSGAVHPQPIADAAEESPEAWSTFRTVVAAFHQLKLRCIPRCSRHPPQRRPSRNERSSPDAVRRPGCPAEEAKPATPKNEKPDMPAFPSESDVKPDPKPEPKPEPKPAEELKLEPAPEPKPAAPANDLFSPDQAPMPEPAPKSGLDDLFGNPSNPAPAEPAPTPMPESTPAPAEPAKSGLDDLFGNPPASAAPAPAPAAEPAKSGLDDLFGSPSTPAPAEAPKPASSDDLFGAPSTPAPADAPKPATTDDLFGSPAPAANTPAPAANPLDDLFSTPNAADANPAPAKNESLDGLFNMNEDAKPKTIEATQDTAMPVSTEADSTPNFDNLFGNPAGATATQSTEETKPEADKKAPEENNFDDLFKSTSAPQQPTFQGAEFRSWIDNTGSYEVKARLVMIYPDRIRLLKENGKHTTVPFTRLSDSDRQYVNWVAVSLTGSKTKFVASETNGAANDIAR